MENKDIVVGDIITFDNPDNLREARWGEVLEIQGNRVKASYIGWGNISEIQKVKKMSATHTNNKSS